MRYLFWVLSVMSSAICFAQDTIAIFPGDQFQKDFFLTLEKVGEKGAVFLFQDGTYTFTKTIHLKSNVHLVGQNQDKTILKFDLGGKGNLIEIKGGIAKKEIKTTVTANVFDTILRLGSLESLDADSFVKVVQKDNNRITSSWAKNSIGEIVKIQAIDTAQNHIYLERLIHHTYIKDSVTIRIIKPIQNVLIKNLTLIREDTTRLQTSHLYFDYAANCVVENVSMLHSNYAFITLDNTLNTRVENSNFTDAFSYGSGGKGYGVAIQFTSSNNMIYGCIFDHLRHGVLLQAGAIGNHILENYFLNGYWEDVKLPKDAAGDIVFHGNYPSYNQVEGNICNTIVVDNSHGMNGPHNVILGNRVNLYGIYFNRRSIAKGEEIIVVNNDILKDGCFKGGIKKHGNLVYDCFNRINGKLRKYEKISDISDENSKGYTIGVPHSFDTFMNKGYQRYLKRIENQ